MGAFEDLILNHSCPYPSSTAPTVAGEWKAVPPTAATPLLPAASPSDGQSSIATALKEGGTWATINWIYGNDAQTKRRAEIISWPLPGAAPVTTAVNLPIIQ